MKIGVVSDTHSLEIPKQLLDDFKKVDLIIHAGDFCTLEDLKIFEAIAEVKAVQGNMDDSQVRKKLPPKQIFKCEGFSIGLVHGAGSPKDVLKNVVKEFGPDQVDIVIFGHSHQPYNETVEKVLYFNPGSPNDIVSAPYCSYGIIEIKDRKIFPKIIKVK
ncbi:MAG: metallophosphoesterase family protein [Candidatus Omnitrophica bacterium]|nr:metallophosphoesterase family protein [Candidatus Omnitrophota bacterium]